MAHFELRLDDGSLMTRTDGSVMELRPSAYMALVRNSSLVFHYDCRTPSTAQFFGGGVEIYVDPKSGRLTYEMPQTAARRELKEEGGARSLSEVFVGNFAMLEPVFLFLSTEWDLPSGDFVLQKDEVSRILEVPISALLDPETRAKWQVEFLRAQWCMVGWLMLHLQGQTKPVFERWYEHDPWEILDSLQ